MPRLSLQHIADIVGGTIHGSVDDPARMFVSRYAFDSRRIEQGGLFFARHGESRDGHDFVKDACAGGAVGAVVERMVDDVPRGFVQIEVPKSLDALQGLAGHVRGRLAIPVVAISGSNGKTTTKEMLAAILSPSMKTYKSPGNFNNHIGLPMAILGVPEATEVLVVELGSNHRGEIAGLSDIAAPTLGVITNVGKAHIGHFGSLAEVAREKTDLIRHLASRGKAVVNGDDRDLLSALGDVNVRTIFFGLGEGLDYRATDIEGDSISGVGFRVAGVRVRLAAAGLHNVYNALAAIAAAAELGVSPAEAADALEGFRPVRTKTYAGAGITIIDDSYNANPDSVRAALALLSGYPTGRKVFVMGEMLELGEASARLHHQAGEAIASSGVDVLIAIGRLTREATVGAFAKGMPADCVFFFEDKAEAIASIRKILAPGDVVLVKGSRGAALEEICIFLGEKTVGGRA
jgi:UDP-N-acetylmuramoyl-tripeptide--D-alanyl-D-alanine ligase